MTEPDWLTRYWAGRTPPKSRAEVFNVVTTPASSGDGDVATIRMYGQISSFGWWSISAEDISTVLDGLSSTVSHIIFRINSPGGEVTEAMTILNMLRAHKAKVTAVVDGLAASSASVIAAGCDETVMSPGSQMMIHSPSSIVWGNAAEMRKTADVLDSFEASIVEIYEGKAGAKDWAQLLADETWLVGAKAVELGLADRVAIVPDAGETSTVGNEDEDDDFYFEDAARMRPAASSTPVASASGSPTPTGKETAVATFSDDQLNTMRASLGLPEDADETAIIAAVTARPASAPLPEGVEAIDATALAELRQNAQAGVEAREQQRTEHRERLVDGAIAKGKFAASRREHFIALHKADPEGTETLISALAENTIPVAEIGYDADGETVTAVDDDTFNAYAARMGLVKGASL